MCSTRLGGQNDLKPPIRDIFKERNVLKYRIRGHFFNVHSIASKRAFFQVSLECLGVIFSISLAVFRGGLQISSSRIGRQLYRELYPRGYDAMDVGTIKHLKITCTRLVDLKYINKKYFRIIIGSIYFALSIIEVKQELKFEDDHRNF